MASNPKRLNTSHLYSLTFNYCVVAGLGGSTYPPAIAGGDEYLTLSEFKSVLFQTSINVIAS